MPKGWEWIDELPSTERIVELTKELILLPTVEIAKLGMLAVKVNELKWLLEHIDDVFEARVKEMESESDAR